MILIVSAISSETKRLITLLKGSKVETIPGLWKSEEENVFISALGVGYLEAALKLRDLLFQIDIKQVEGIIFCGTAGVYNEQDGLGIGDICSCCETILTDAAAEAGLSHFATPLIKGPIQSSFQLQLELSEACVMTLLTLTLSEEIAGTIGSRVKGAVENMELFGIARVCDDLKIPWNAVLGITNQVGSKGNKQWTENHLDQENKLCDFLAEYLR